MSVDREAIANTTRKIAAANDAAIREGARTGLLANVSHPKCRTEAGHVCQKPSGRVCVESGCDKAAGTLWGPLWCPEDDQERLDRVSAGFAEVAASFSASAPTGEGTDTP